MAEKRTRYNELLGIPSSIRDPDLYQLIGLDRTNFDQARVETCYREQMRKLQAIRSPKHKSFIEFLKGELRRARTVLTDARKRQGYDAELKEERHEQLGMILTVVLADGHLSPPEEDRIRSVAADVGLLPSEADSIIEEEMRKRGAKRDAGSSSDRGLVQPTSRPGGAPPVPSPATDSDIQRVVQRRLKKRPPPAPRRGPPPPHDEVVTAELVESGPPSGQQTPITAELVETAPPRQPTGGWHQKAQPASQTGWGKGSVKKKAAGVCSGCLGQVTEDALTHGKAERLPDGRIHCPGCTNRLIAGLICAACYQRVTRSEMKDGALVIQGGRVSHRRCLG